MTLQPSVQPNTYWLSITAVAISGGGGGGGGGDGDGGGRVVVVVVVDEFLLSSLCSDSATFCTAQHLLTLHYCYCYFWRWWWWWW